MWGRGGQGAPALGQAFSPGSKWLRKVTGSSEWTAGAAGPLTHCRLQTCPVTHLRSPGGRRTSGTYPCTDSDTAGQMGRHMPKVT